MLGYDMTELCFTENDRLNQTEYTRSQPFNRQCGYYPRLKRKRSPADALV